jgi:hypothetical protein
MQDIRIDVGVCTVINITLLKEHFTGVKEVIFTVKNYASVGSEVIIERVFTEAGEHEIVIKPEESIKLCNTAEYDFNAVLENGTRLKMTDNGKVILRKSVGDCID